MPAPMLISIRSSRATITYAPVVMIELVIPVARPACKFVTA
eukprot:COSAG01_NODE_841_length_13175_cov_26.426124_11_plen_41_part_00